MKGPRIAAVCVAALGILAAFQVFAAAGDAPRYTVDPTWPKQLPNNWIMGQVGGVAVDAQDHIWVLQKAELIDCGRTGRRTDTAPQ